MGPTDDGPFDRVFIGGALPRFHTALRKLLDPNEGRAVAFLKPRFRAQDLVCIVRRGDDIEERLITRVRVPIVIGKHGWIQTKGPTHSFFATNPA